MTDSIYPTVRGWQCPVCQSVWAPFVSRCEECAKQTKETPTGADINAGCAHVWSRHLDIPHCLECGVRKEPDTSATT